MPIYRIITQTEEHSSIRKNEKDKHTGNMYSGSYFSKISFEDNSNVVVIQFRTITKYYPNEFINLFEMSSTNYFKIMCSTLLENTNEAKDIFIEILTELYIISLLKTDKDFKIKLFNEANIKLSPRNLENKSDLKRDVVQMLAVWAREGV
jgi:hypothetical protein